MSREISSVEMTTDEFSRLLGLPDGVRVWKVATQISDGGHRVEMVFHADTDVITDAQFQVWYNAMCAATKPEQRE